MKSKHSISCILLLVSILLAGSIIQKAEAQPSFQQSNPAIPFDRFISGVKYIAVEMEPADQKHIDEQGSRIMETFELYLRSLGFSNVAITTTSKMELYNNVSSVCDVAKVYPIISVGKDYFGNLKMVFVDCLGNYYEFSNPVMIYNDENIFNNFTMEWQRMYNKKVTYQAANRLRLPVQSTPYLGMNKNQLFSSKMPVGLEGVYKKVPETNNSSAVSELEFAVLKDTNQPDTYNIIYLKGLGNSEDWQAGERMGTVKETGTKAYYQVLQWLKYDKRLLEKANLTLDKSNMLYLTYFEGETKEQRFFRTFPKESAKLDKYTMPPRASFDDKKLLATGSGISITPDGYIVTNYHVVHGGKYFQVSCKRDGLVEHYKAKLIITDEKNDLSVLKIEDPFFIDLQAPPFTMRTTAADVGEKIFVMGYPLTSTMGTELKVVDGIISARSGFKGDVSCYQITAEVHSGNSGGPVFDQNGFYIGNVKAKHSKAGNATYVIKSRLVLNILELLPKGTPIPVANRLQNLELKDQIRELESYVFLIKVFVD